MAIYSKVSGIGASVIKSVDGISISKIRSINASLSSAFALLLDERYGFGAEAAYSVRRLSGVYNGPLLVVRRDSDDATLEVGFTFNNDLDVSAIETFCGTANGYVTEWRDQSGNLNHAAQTAETSQPKIYDATTGIELNAGRPALNFAADFFDLTRTISTDPLALFSMHRDGSNRYFPLYQDSNNYVFFHTSYGQLRSKLSGQFSIENYSSKGEMGLRSFIQYTDGSEARSYVNGVDVTQVGGYQITTQQGSFTDLGLPGTGYTGLAQEVIVYSANKSGDRTDIEGNIANYYGDNVELLDTYTGAAAAYSLRKLSSSYNGALVRVREDGTDTQADIYANVFGELDTIALANHCGSNNGLVVGWYDQSGNLNNATQPSDTAQPKIYDATTGVVTENGKPAITKSGNTSYLDVSSFSMTQPYSSIFVAKHLNNSSTRFNAAFSTIDDSVNFDTDSFSGNNSFVMRAGGFLQTIGNRDFVQHLWSTLWNGSSSYAYKDGTLEISGNAGSNNMNSLRLGGLNAFGTLQEFIFYDSDESTDRTNIEDNINTFYGIYDTGLIGEYSGAAAAYSLRSLSSVYDGAAITVRRDSDDNTKNIYFDSDGNLDTAALTGFCGNNNGYIARWFDQSGNSNNATQPSDTAQPKIYDATTGVVTENGKPAVEFDGTNDSLGASSAVVTGAEFFCSVVLTMGTQGSPWADQGTLGIRPYQASATNLRVQYNTDNGSFQMTGDNSGSGQRLKTTRLISGTQEIYDNGLLATSATNTFTSLASNDALIFGRRYNSGSSTFFNGKSQEFVFYTSDQSANRTGIETNINNNYLIYQPDTAPTSGLLASYPGAAAAYSLRQLSNEAVIAVTVRRDSDDNVSPIGFDGRGLDTEALAAWCGNSNGYVTTWWDQSTLGNHATQPSDTAQPKIYDATTGVVTENGKPAIYFEGSFISAPSVSMSSATCFVHHTNFDANARMAAAFDRYDNSFFYDQVTGYWVRNGGSIQITGLPSTTSKLVYALLDSAGGELGINGATATTGTLYVKGGTMDLDIGKRLSSYWKGTFSEVVVYDSDQSSNRTNIEDNINGYYDIY